MVKYRNVIKRRVRDENRMLMGNLLYWIYSGDTVRISLDFIIAVIEQLADREMP